MHLLLIYWLRNNTRINTISSTAIHSLSVECSNYCNNEETYFVPINFTSFPEICQLSRLRHKIANRTIFVCATATYKLLLEKSLNCAQK